MRLFLAELAKNFKSLSLYLRIVYTLKKKLMLDLPQDPFHLLYFKNFHQK